jgi:GAF domain-containing protein
MRPNVADLHLELENPGPRPARAQRGAEWVRQARAYRWVGIYDVTSTEIAAIAWTGPTAPAFPRFPRSQGLSGAAVASGEPVVVQDVAADPRYLTAFGSTRAEAIFPIRAPSGGVIVGTLDVESDQRNAFTPEDVSFLEACASTLGALWEGDVPNGEY